MDHSSGEGVRVGTARIAGVPGKDCRVSLLPGGKRAYERVKLLASLTMAGWQTYQPMDRVVHWFPRRHKEAMQATGIANTSGGSAGVAANGRLEANGSNRLPSFAQVIAEKIANPPASEKNSSANASQDHGTRGSGSAHTPSTTTAGQAPEKPKQNGGVAASKAKAARATTGILNQSQLQNAGNIPAQTTLVVADTEAAQKPQQRNSASSAGAGPVSDATLAESDALTGASLATATAALATAVTTAAATATAATTATTAAAITAATATAATVAAAMVTTENTALAAGADRAVATPGDVNVADAKRGQPKQADAASNAEQMATDTGKSANANAGNLQISTGPILPAAAGVTADLPPKSDLKDSKNAVPQQARVKDTVSVEKSLPAATPNTADKTGTQANAPADKPVVAVTNLGPKIVELPHGTNQVQVKDVLRDLASTAGKQGAQTFRMSTNTAAEASSAKIHVSAPVVGAVPAATNKLNVTPDVKHAGDSQSAAKAAGETAVQRASTNGASTQDNTSDSADGGTNAGSNSASGGVKQKSTENFATAMTNSGEVKADSAGSSSVPVSSGSTLKEPATEAKQVGDAAPDERSAGMPDEKKSTDSGGSTNVSSAQITTAAGQSEMHIAMQTEKLGTVELHAQLTGEHVGAAITVDKKEAHAALAAELPALQQALSDKQIRVEHVWLVQGKFDHATGGQAHSSAQHQQRNQGEFRDREQDGRESMPTFLGRAVHLGEIYDAQGRLSVLA